MQKTTFRLPEAWNDQLMGGLQRKDTDAIQSALRMVAARGHLSKLSSTRLYSIERDAEYTVLDAMFAYDCPAPAFETAIDLFARHHALSGGSADEWIEGVLREALSKGRRDVWMHLLQHPAFENETTSGLDRKALSVAVKACAPTECGAEAEVIAQFLQDVIATRAPRLHHWDTSPVVEYLRKVAQCDDGSGNGNGVFDPQILQLLTETVEHADHRGTSTHNPLDLALMISDPRVRAQAIDTLVSRGGEKLHSPELRNELFTGFGDKSDQSVITAQRRCLRLLRGERFESVEECLVFRYASEFIGGQGFDHALAVLPVPTVSRLIRETISFDSAVTVPSAVERLAEKRPEAAEAAWSVIAEWARANHKALCDVSVSCLLGYPTVREALAPELLTAGRRLHGLSLTQHAVARDRVDLLSCLIEAGADINERDGVGNGLLHYAMDSQVIRTRAIVDALVAAGCDPSTQNLAGVSPALLVLIGAGKELESSEHPRVIPSDVDDLRALFDVGADLTVMDNEGRSALSCLRDALARNHFAGPDTDKRVLELCREIEARAAHAHVTVRGRKCAPRL